MMNTGLFRCYTLVDISQTNVIRSSNDPAVNKNRNKQRNLETLLQIIGLRAQPNLRMAPLVKYNQNLKDYKFGDHYSGSHTVWELQFEVEQSDVFAHNGDEFALLNNDINHVPIITGLDETVEFLVPVFSSTLDTLNVYFEYR